MSKTASPPGRQNGLALVAILAILVVGGTAVLIGSLSITALHNAQQEATSAALAQAKEAIVGDTIADPSVTSAGHLHLPDLGFKVGLSPSEGSSAPNFSGNNKDYSVIGKLPWKTLGLKALRDGQNECLWYAVSGRFKNTPTTDSLNWDTPGQIDVIDGSGNVIASNLAALVIAPGQTLDGQTRSLSDTVYTQCGGNYDARNYLDAYNGADALSGTVNYFSGSINNRIASDSGNRQFVMTNTAHYNDRFLFISADDIFRPIIRRSDFSAQIASLMNDPYFQSAPLSGSKGTGSVSCTGLSASNQTFCKNWKEMLLLTQLPAPSLITLDGAPTAACARVLIFGGKKTASQTRITASDKAAPANYLEGINLTAFTTASSNFSGASNFDANNPGADLLRCLP